MLESLRVRTHICTGIRGGPLGSWVDAFVVALQATGFAPSVIRRHVRAAAAFGGWLARQHLTVNDVDTSVITQFVARLRRWRSASRPRGRVSETATGVRALVAFLHTHGVALRDSCRPAEHDADRWLQSFDTYLTRVRGVTTGTRRIYLRYARDFVTTYFGIGPVTWTTLTPDVIAQFVQTKAAALSPSTCRAPVTATRIFLKFLVTTGVMPARFVGAVPTIRQWKHATLPGILSHDDLEGVLAAVDPTRGTGARDRAVLLLLARLGLRASDIAALRLDHLNWRDGQILVPPGKSGRERLVPLSHEVGSALVAALRDRRDAATLGAVFVRSRPPYRPLSAAAVTGIAQRRLRRAGVSGHRLGAHVFRHTIATHLVQRGVAMKAVADLLGHARLETTAIYAKLDLDTLAAVALPWPGGAQ